MVRPSGRGVLSLAGGWFRAFTAFDQEQQRQQSHRGTDHHVGPPLVTDGRCCVPPRSPTSASGPPPALAFRATVLACLDAWGRPALRLAVATWRLRPPCSRSPCVVAQRWRVRSLCRLVLAVASPPQPARPRPPCRTAWHLRPPDRPAPRCGRSSTPRACGPAPRQPLTTAAALPPNPAARSQPWRVGSPYSPGLRMWSRLADRCLSSSFPPHLAQVREKGRRAR